jgi:hypothetical protein
VGAYRICISACGLQRNYLCHPNLALDNRMIRRCFGACHRVDEVQRLSHPNQSEIFFQRHDKHHKYFHRQYELLALLSQKYVEIQLPRLVFDLMSRIVDKN